MKPETLQPFKEEPKRIPIAYFNGKVSGFREYLSNLRIGLENSRRVNFVNGISNGTIERNK